MDILITGNISTFAFSLAKYFIEENHSVVVTGATQEFLSLRANNLTAFKIDSSDPEYREIYRSHTFDTVIFIAAREDSILDMVARGIANTNFGLESNLEFSQNQSVDHFIYISSYEVYGSAASTLESTTPKPSTKIGQLLLNGENLCRFYAENRSLPITILHIPFIYGPNEEHSFVSQLVQKVKSKKKIIININKLAHCSFLQIDDLSIFFNILLQDKNDKGFQVFNLFQKGINFSFLAQQLNFYFPKTKIEFLDTNKTPPNLKAEGTTAKETFNWSPKYQLIKDLPALLEKIKKVSSPKKPFLEKLRELTSKQKIYLVWGEVILGAFVMHMLTIWSSTIIEFKYIDYRLLYVIIIGSTHGLIFGALAALLAAVSSALNWYQVGLDWALLVYNVENWVPFALFFLAGAVTGYVHDKKENELTFEQHQTELIHEKYEFLYTLYDDISSIKEKLREQLVGYRDSFGRFFRIANELNELDEDNVFLKAIDVLEDLMKNKRIAIYSVESSGFYGRLVVKSSNLGEEIPKSLKLSDYSHSLDLLNNGSVFQNKNLLPNYPSYIAPINSPNGLIGLVVIWEAEFEQFSLYYLNLFKVITGLIQSSLVRATTFKNARIEKLYIPSTEIMLPEPFAQVLEAKKKMRRSKMSNFLVVRIEKRDFSWIDLYGILFKGIRKNDVTGVINKDDAHCFVLLANANSDNMNLILERLQKLGLEVKYIEELESD